METVSAFYISYARYSLFIVFIVGIAVAAYVGAKQSKRYTVGKMPPLTNFFTFEADATSYIFRRFRADLSFFIPIGIWVLAFGVFATSLDMVLGSQ